MNVTSLRPGHFYFRVTYPDSTLMKPIVASFEFVGTEETALEDSPEDFETYYLNRAGILGGSLV